MRLSKKEKELLQVAFDAPKPKNKRKFLRTLPKHELTVGALILSQAAYIRKWVFAISLLLFGVIVWMAQYVELSSVWMLSAVMPFAAVLLITEFAKSTAYGMAELEMTSRFPIRVILLARMAMVGAVQLLGLIIAAPVAGIQLLQNGVYLLVPYLLTTLLGLIAVRKWNGKEGVYVSGSIAAFVSVLCPLGGYYVPVMYAGESFFLWILAAVLLMVGLVKEYQKTMNQMETFV